MMSFLKSLLGLFIVAIALIGGAYLYVNAERGPSITELSEVEESGVSYEATLYDKVVSQADLPPEGTRSLFDHLVAENDGLPFPFSEFVDLLQSMHPEGEAPITVLIPQGRSLLKGQTNEEHPRIVLASDFHGINSDFGLGLASTGQLFLGFVEEASEIEVLSYNEAAGRFEFQLVQNYCEGCVPKIVYAKRAICQTCHQGGTPIFPQRPWSETNGQLLVSDLIKASRSSHEPYLGSPLEQPLAAPERFDELTDIGTYLIVAQRLWVDACGVQGNDCRRLMLKLALSYLDNPGQFDEQSEAAQNLLAMMSDVFPEQGIAVPESDLKNRDPYGESESFADWLFDTLTPDIEFGSGAKDNEDLSAFEKLPPLQARFDPLTKRTPKKVIQKTELDGVYNLAQFFTDMDLSQLQAHYEYSLPAMQQAVDALPESLFDDKPFSRVEVMRALLDKELDFCCLDTAHMSEPQVSGAPPLVIDQHPELQAFEQYCFACHRGNPSKRLNFMAGETEQVVLASIQDQDTIRESLDWSRYQGTDQSSKIMPPADSIQYQMLKEAGEGVRESMRETVPSLFSF